MDEFIKWPENEQEETSEPQAIDIGAEGIGIEKDEQAVNMDMPIYIPVFLFTKLTPRREAVYWVDFCGYPLIANDPNELLILQNQMQDEVRQSEARQLMTLQTGIDPGCNRRLVDNNGVFILLVKIELD
ncbi:25296_t:CDS:2 [Dentiscutata erythropus]|uniref:25296_t:CDS:1 n=1 Tax=Dentiscutata erythropus TaxID=1348616 RepID=A0A9N8VUN5_9GLOM|nr:25296_t:CDS:2 [Dentiscutata erythropus]